MLASTLINRCALEYQDVGFNRILQPNWLDYLNDAQLATVLVRPDANSVTESFKLAAGTRQALPSGGLRVLDMIRNMGSNGSTPGRTIRSIDTDVQDSVSPNWHTSTASVIVREFFYNDKRNPLVFYVNPPVPSSPDVYVELTTSKAPATITDAVNGSIGLADVYSPALSQWMLFKAYALATQASNQFQRAQFYYNSFFNVLGVKLKGELFFAANTAGMLPGNAAQVLAGVNR